MKSNLKLRNRMFRVGWFAGWLVGFYGKSAIVIFLMPNPVYTYILNINE